MTYAWQTLHGAIRFAGILSAAQVRMFVNQTLRSREPARLILLLLGGLFVLFLWVQELAGTLLASEALQRLPSRFGEVGGQDVTQVVGAILVGYAVLLVFSSALFSLNALLLNPDLDLLLVSPWRVDTVLGARMLNQVVRMVLLSFVFVMPLLVGLGFVQRQPLVPVLLITILAVYPVMFVIGASVVILLIIRFIPPARAREAMALLGITFAGVINLANFTLNPALRSHPRSAIPNIPLATAPWSPLGWASRATAAVLTGDPLAVLTWGGLFLAATITVFVVGTRLSGLLYLSGWAQGAWGSPSRVRRSPATITSGRARRRSPTMALVIKDWRIRRRDLAQLTGLVMPLGFFAVILAFNGPRLLRTIQPLGAGPMTALVAIAPVLLILLSLTTALGLSAVSLEGRGIWIYAASPNTMRGLLEAKCWAAAIPVMTVSLVLGTVLEVFVHPGLPWSVGALALLVVVSGALACVMVGLGGVVGRFDWTDARRMIHPVGGLVALLVQFGMIFAVGVLVVAPLLVASFFHQSVLGLFLAGVLAASLAAVLTAAVALVLAEQRLRRLEV